ncbi:MAG: hypothetical protein ACP5R5_08100 [Armatimonadota bacterium]
MKIVSVFFLAALIVGFSIPTSALGLFPYNEIVNGDFGTGDLTGWQHGCDIIVARDGPGHGYAATCKCPGGDLWLRQIVDDSLSPGWNWDWHAKVVDLIADITWQGWEPSRSAIAFRLDWWDESYNGVSDPRNLPYYQGGPPPGPDPGAGYFTSDWVVYDFAGTPPSQWATVNPFSQFLLPLQPRWVSVEVVFTQAAGESVWLDNVVLTGKCVPEPSGIAALLGACGALAAGVRTRRK